MSVWAEAAARLRRRPGRAILAAAGIVLASAMLGTATIVVLGLTTGFERSARRADLPDVIARFDSQPRERVDRRLAALPNVAGRAYRFEVVHVSLAAGSHETERGAVQVVEAGRHGYGLVAGRDMREGAEEALVEPGFARAWGLRPGDALRVGRVGELRIAGVVVAPDNVGFPLASAPRIYLTRSYIERRFGPDGRHDVNEALLWVNDRSRLDVTLEQARATSYGIRQLRFVTRDGVRVLIDRAAGIVIALLVAVSLVALAVASAMLAASARAEVARSLPVIGLRRALGFPRRAIAASHGAEAALIAVPAAAIGLGLGAALASGPTSRLLEGLNELSAGGAALGPLLALWGAVVLLVVAGATWPAWRATGLAPVALLRGAELRAAPGSRSRGGLFGLGVRLVAARRARLLVTIGVLTVSAGFVALMLALGSLLGRLEHDPQTVGKRYQLTVTGEPGLAEQARRVPGVVAVAPRLEVAAADSFALGETLKLIAYPGDHTAFEAPALDSGRRVARDGEAEVGVGLASALGVRVGSTLATQLPTGREARFRVVGVVRALDNDGRVAYVRPARLLAAGVAPARTLAVRLAPGTPLPAARDALAALAPGGVPAVTGDAGAATASSASFLTSIASLVRVVALVDALVCLFALAQALALATRERRGDIALLRALGAGRPTLTLLFTGAAAVLVAPAAVLGLLLERFVFGPVVAHLAAGYVSLPLGAGVLESLVVVLGLGAMAGGAALWAGVRAQRDPIVTGLREE